MMQKAMQSLPGDIAAALGPILAEFAAKQGQKEVSTVSTVSTGQVDTPEKPQIIIDKGKTYTRETHPLLFEVVDLLETNKDMRAWSVRKLSGQVRAGKSWCAVAKRYWQSRNA